MLLLAKTFGVLASLMLFGPVSATSQTPYCSAAQYHAMDFWLGNWTVTDRSRKKTLGHSRIERVAGGCAVMESWSGTLGDQGKSLSYYDPATGKWVQHYVGSRGHVSDYEGSGSGRSMVFLSHGPGAQLTRMTFTPLADKRVRQLFETSSDNGKTWSAGFDGYYGS